MANKMTIIYGKYGSYERPVIYVDYHNGGEIPTYDIGLKTVDLDLVKRIQYAVENGYEIKFEDNR